MAILYFTQSVQVLNWASASSWQPQQVPTLGDYCIFDSSSATCSLNTNGTCSQIDFTTFNKQFRFNANSLLIYGTISFGNQMSFSYSTTSAPYPGYNLAIVASASITSNGCTVAVPTIFYNQGTASNPNNNFYTLNDNLTISENFSTGSPNAVAQTHTINGATLSLYKNFAINTGGNLASNLTTGSSNIVMLGTGSITTSINSTGGLGNTLTINTIGTITMPFNFYYRTGTFKLLSGKLTATNLVNTGSYTLDLSISNSGNIQSITLAPSVTSTIITLLSDAHILGFGQTTLSTTINGADIYAYGTTPISSQGSSSLLGTTTLRICGTSSASTATVGNSGNINCNISIQTPGTVNWNQVQWYAQSGGASLVYTSGTMLYSGTNFQIGAGANMHTFYTSGMTFNNINSFSSNPVNVNLQQPLYATLLSVNSNPTVFTGSYGFSVSTLSGSTPPTPGRIGLSLQPNITYLVNRNLTIQPNVLNGFIFGIKSNIVGQQAKFILALGASQTVYTAVTDNIDSSGGQTIWPYYYDVATASTNTLNWKRLQSFSLQSSMLNIS